MSTTIIEIPDELELDDDYDLTPLMNLPRAFKDNAVFNISGVIVSISETTHIQRMKDNKLIPKYDIRIADQHKKLVNITVWSDDRVDIVDNTGRAVILTRVKTKVYNGHPTFTLTQDSEKIFDDTIHEIRVLNEWWTAHSSVRGDLGPLFQFSIETKRVVIANMIHDLVEMPAEVYAKFVIRGKVVNFDDRLHFYKSCPNVTCYKKLEERSSGTYWCPRCRHEARSHDVGATTSSEIEDVTGQRVECTVFGMTISVLFDHNLDDVTTSASSMEPIRALRDKVFDFKISAKRCFFSGGHKNVFAVQGCDIVSDEYTLRRLRLDFTKPGYPFSLQRSTLFGGVCGDNRPSGWWLARGVWPES
ncbi:replication protein A 70 kDa DNA-binding subunit B-like [Galendromus occidentalis]|uniref:Replication protein A 70 kDa DNA-binding subunit B-like n=1 Tax=Galendromus occidentalis TaxID=34638 RepID=A0AAJ7L6C4_9ACAR|nr:replication protein A 70 kDa DNA-binding subunit B-like [Galendromus occidentalis]